MAELQTASRQAPHQPDEKQADPSRQLMGQDAEAQRPQPGDDTMRPGKNISAFKGLGWLDRFLAIWIFLAMVVGILLGNFVPNTEEALNKGKFVGVSVPIGMSISVVCRTSAYNHLGNSGWPPRHDVPYPVQGALRDAAPYPAREGSVEADSLQRRRKLDRCSVLHGKSQVHSIFCMSRAAASAYSL